MKDKIKEVEIKSYFYGAGSPKQFNWIKDGYHIFGVGIKVEDLIKYEKLKIKIGSNHYQVSTNKAKEFIENYKSFYKVRNHSILLGVFSKSLLTNITVVN